MSKRVEWMAVQNGHTNGARKNGHTTRSEFVDLNATNADKWNNKHRQISGTDSARL